MKKKIIGSVLVLGIVAAAAGLFVPNAVQKITKESVITSSQLEKAVDISELSTAEFIYNGIADKYSDGNLTDIDAIFNNPTIFRPDFLISGFQPFCEKATCFRLRFRNIMIITLQSGQFTHRSNP